MLPNLCSSRKKMSRWEKTGTRNMDSLRIMIYNAKSKRIWHRIMQLKRVPTKFHHSSLGAESDVPTSSCYSRWGETRPISPLSALFNTFKIIDRVITAGHRKFDVMSAPVLLTFNFSPDGHWPILYSWFWLLFIPPYFLFRALGLTYLHSSWSFLL